MTGEKFEPSEKLTAEKIFENELRRGGLLFSDVLNVIGGMGMQLRVTLRKLSVGESSANKFRMADGSVHVFMNYADYVNSKISEEDREYILQNSNPDAVREFDALVDEYNNKILPAAELDEKLWQQEGVKNGFITKAQAMLDKIKEFDQRVSIK